MPQNYSKSREAAFWRKFDRLPLDDKQRFVNLIGEIMRLTEEAKDLLNSKTPRTRAR